jgi:hypothetical protein
MTAVAPSTTRRTRALASSLLARHWLKRSTPFTHWVAYDVFVPEVYDRLVRSFTDAVLATAGQAYLPGHDIYGQTVTPETADGFEPLVSREWHDMLARVTGVRATGNIACGLHHHRGGGANGFPHNDLNPGWFGRLAEPGEIVLSDGAVDYTSGAPLVSGATPVETVRAAAVLLYLANPPWTPGDGGVTGLYATADAPAERPLAVVPPVNNSLLLFECTPQSYHGYVATRRNPRNSIVMWLHRTVQEVEARWGRAAVVPYGLEPGTAT